MTTLSIFLNGKPCQPYSEAWNTDNREILITKVDGRYGAISKHDRRELVANIYKSVRDLENSLYVRITTENKPNSENLYYWNRYMPYDPSISPIFGGLLGWFRRLGSQHQNFNRCDEMVFITDNESIVVAKRFISSDLAGNHLIFYYAISVRDGRAMGYSSSMHYLESAMNVRINYKDQRWVAGYYTF